MNERVQQDIKTASPSRFRLRWLAQAGALARVGQTALVRPEVRLPGIVTPGAHHEPKTNPIVAHKWLAITFFLMVVVPTAVAGVYFGVIASNIYVSEAKFAIRGSVEKLPSSSGAGAAALPGMASSLAAVNNSQESYVVASYIKSAPLVEKLDRDDKLRSLFARNDVDLLSRLRSSSSLEALRDYWDKMVTASVDNLSGVLTLKVDAFAPQDALAISRAVLAASEALVNDMSKRRLDDAVKNANEELARADQRLQAARLAMQDFRNRSGQLDPVKQTTSTLELLTALRTERVTVESELQTSRRTLNDKSPSVQVLSTRLQAIKDQTARLERLMTSQNASDQTASRALLEYEGLEVERLFAEKLYLVARAGVERARMNAERQQLYFVTFVEPNLAERALYPRRLTSIIVVFVCAAALWSILSLLVATVRDHHV